MLTLEAKLKGKDWRYEWREAPILCTINFISPGATLGYSAQATQRRTLGLVKPPINYLK
jgi:hypothetical protein